MKSNNIRRRWHCTLFVLCSLLVISLLSPLSGFSKNNDLSAFIEEIQRASDRVITFSCTFVQEKKLAMFTNPVVFHGNLTIVRPHKLRWEFTSPVPSVLIFREDKGMRCNDQAPPSQFDLRDDPVMKSVADQLWLWLGGDYSRFDDLYTLEKGSGDTLRIFPKDSSVSGFIEVVEMTFSHDDKQPEKVVITEPGGDVTTLTFHSYLINKKIDDKLFSQCRIDE